MVAGTKVCANLISSPVLRLRSKRGKLLLEISSRRVWPAQKDVAGGPEIDGDFVNLPGIHQVACSGGSTVAHAEDAFGEILRKAVGRDVDELGGEVGIDGRGFHEKVGGDRAGDFQVASSGRWNKPARRHDFPRSAGRAGQAPCGQRRSRAGRRWWGRDSRDCRCKCRRVRIWARMEREPSPRSEFALPMECRKYFVWLRLRRRPVVLLAIFIRAHGEDIDGFIGGEFVLDSFEEEVVPIEDDVGVDVLSGMRTEVDVADCAAETGVATNLRSADAAWCAPRRSAVGFDAHVVAERPPLKMSYQPPT